MKKNGIAFVFPGQGAQKVGMGKELYDRFPSASSLMERANGALGFDLASLCFNGPEDELSRTENTQPALLAVGAMALEVFREKCGIAPDFVAGHSLGEFTALYAAGAYSFEDAIWVVRKRGEYMSAASGGGMAAVLGLDASLVEDACREISGGASDLQPANYNGDGQTVIAGTKEAIEKAVPLLKEKGAKRVIPLNVAAAFHTPAMRDAAERLAVDLDGLRFSDLSVPLVNNVDSKVVGTANEAREGLKRQVMGAVRWTQTMNELINNGVRTIVEFGTGKTLLGMFRRADKTLMLYNVEDEESLASTVEGLS